MTSLSKSCYILHWRSCHSCILPLPPVFCDVWLRLNDVAYEAKGMEQGGICLHAVDNTMLHLMLRLTDKEYVVFDFEYDLELGDTQGYQWNFKIQEEKVSNFQWLLWSRLLTWSGNTINYMEKCREELGDAFNKRGTLVGWWCWWAQGLQNAAASSGNSSESFLDFCHYHRFPGGNTKILTAFHTFAGSEVNKQSFIS